MEVFEGGLAIPSAAQGEHGGDFPFMGFHVGADEHEIPLQDAIAHHGIAPDAQQEIPRAPAQEVVYGKGFDLGGGVRKDLLKGACGDGPEDGQRAEGGGGRIAGMQGAEEASFFRGNHQALAAPHPPALQEEEAEGGHASQGRAEAAFGFEGEFCDEIGDKTGLLALFAADNDFEDAFLRLGKRGERRTRHFIV
jgi:hypothetical protein